MDRDNSDSNTTAFASVALFRGIYNRVALRLGVDPSYVSRVARGERNSDAVRQALAEELKKIREHLNGDGALSRSNSIGNGGHKQLDGQSDGKPNGAVEKLIAGNGLTISGNGGMTKFSDGHDRISPNNHSGRPDKPNQKNSLKKKASATSPIPPSV